MALKQIHIDWESVPHKLENNKFSQSHLDANRHHFRGQAALVFAMLMKGVRLDKDVADAHGISHLPRRIGDLGDSNKIKLVEGFEQPQKIKSSTFGIKYMTSEFGLYIDREWGLKDGKETELMVYFLPAYRDEFINHGWIKNKKRWWYSEKYTHPEIIKQIKEGK